MLEPVEAAFDDVAAAVGGPVEAAEALASADAAVDLVDPFRDRGLDPAFAQVGADLGGRVALVRGHSVRSGPGAAGPASLDADGCHHGFELGAVVDVAGGEGESQGAAVSVAGEMDLGGQSAAGSADGLARPVLPLFRAPAAC